MILDQWDKWECKEYGFATALFIMNPSIDKQAVISAITEDPAWLLTNRKAWEFFVSHWFIKWIEQVPRLKAKALLNRGIPLVANITGVDWEKTSKPPYIASFDGHIGSHNCTIVWYDNKTRLLTIANTYGEQWWDKWLYYLHAENLSKVSEFCKIIL
jgi:hypothetical protein